MAAMEITQTVLKTVQCVPKITLWCRNPSPPPWMTKPFSSHPVCEKGSSVSHFYAHPRAQAQGECLFGPWGKCNSLYSRLFSCDMCVHSGMFWKCPETQYETHTACAMVLQDAADQSEMSPPRWLVQTAMIPNGALSIRHYLVFHVQESFRIYLPHPVALGTLRRTWRRRRRRKHAHSAPTEYKFYTTSPTACTAVISLKCRLVTIWTALHCCPWRGVFRTHDNWWNDQVDDDIMTIKTVTLCVTGWIYSYW